MTSAHTSVGADNMPPTTGMASSPAEATLQGAAAALQPHNVMRRSTLNVRGVRCIYKPVPVVIY